MVEVPHLDVEEGVGKGEVGVLDVIVGPAASTTLIDKVDTLVDSSVTVLTIVSAGCVTSTVLAGCVSSTVTVESSVFVAGGEVWAGAVTVLVISIDCNIVVSATCCAAEDEGAEPEPELEPSMFTTEYVARGRRKTSLGWSGRGDVRKGRDEDRSNFKMRSQRMLHERRERWIAKKLQDQGGS